jgi:hypothetical protein
MTTGTLARRFWEKVQRGQPSECWEWTGSRSRDGYGRIRSGGRDGTLNAHRVAWELTHGPVDDGLQVCHKCDNPPCCNPSHLFVGSKSENAFDALRKGRLRIPVPNFVRTPGVAPGARLTVEQVLEIRAQWNAAGARATAIMLGTLAEQYGVSRTAIYYIVTGHSWRFLLSADWAQVRGGHVELTQAGKEAMEAAG